MVKVILLIVLIVSCSTTEEHKDLTYFSEGKFKNIHSSKKKRSFWTFINMRLFGEETSAKWPEQVELKELNTKLSKQTLRPEITFINHSTFLIQVDNLNILTDPVFSERTSPVQWAGPKRVIKPGIKKENIPKVDIIIISHNHYDHLDYDSLEYFKKRDNPKIYAGLEVGNINKDFEINELKWWEEVKEESFKLVFTPCQHFSGRSLWDRNESLWGGFYFKSKNLSFYFAGDTGYSNHFSEVNKRYGAVDVAFLPIGAYAPRWFMKYVHMDPAEAVQAHFDLNAKLSLGMHWGTFQLTYEPRMEPVEQLEKIKSQKDLSNFKALEFGQKIKL
jgi:L-ascorbate metabolism protein UlaG (beta-lactamase superfamily)